MAAAEPALPELIGGFRVVGSLGSGGMGSVYEGEEPNIGRRVAIKVLRSRLADDPAFVERFRNEARLANSVEHPAIVDVFAFGQLEDGRPYFVMPLLEGESLRALLDREGKLPPARAWQVAREVAAALGAAHARDLAHRDLKPDNVFLETRGGHERVRLMDFGIAKSLSGSGSDGPKTQTGLLLGTPAYMAPEQWWGAKIDVRVDQYALGAMLFEMLAGEPPFDPHHESGVMKLHLHEPPPKLESFGLSTEAGELVSRLLAKEPADRFPSMVEAIAAGDAAFGREPPARSGHTELSHAATELLPTPVHGDAPAPVEAAAGPAAPAALGALASAAPRSAVQRRWLACHVAALVATLGALFAVGYVGPGRFDPRQWLHIGGWGMYPVLAIFVAAAVLVPVLASAEGGLPRFRTLALVLGLGAGPLGAMGTYVGWETVSRALPKVTPIMAFEIFNQGSWEAGAVRFVGLSLAGALSMSLAAGSALHRGVIAPVGPRSDAALAVALFVFGIAGYALDAPSTLMVAVPAAAFVAISRALPLAEADADAQLERSVFGAFAVFFAASAAMERVAGRQTVLWASELDRAGRVRELMAAESERGATLVAIVATAVSLSALQAYRLRNASDLPRLFRRHLVPTIALVAFVATDVALAAKFRDTGAGTRRALASQFALFAELDPPSTAELSGPEFAPSPGAALQVARGAVAVDGREVTRLNTLGAPVGRKRLEDALFDALAKAPNTPLSCLVDRRVKWGDLAEALAVARLAGAVDAELLFTRGPAPELPRRGPLEVAWVLAGDFVAVRVTLVEGSTDLPRDKSLGDLAPELIRAARSGKDLTLHVAAPAPK
ncbi:MAG: serine/threonine protein kinase [Myxococcales bacterium]|nr:serine/threonine protein kinase [Myxococcales bacterium]